MEQIAICGLLICIAKLVLCWFFRDFLFSFFRLPHPFRHEDHSNSAVAPATGAVELRLCSPP